MMTTDNPRYSHLTMIFNHTIRIYEREHGVEKLFVLTNLRSEKENAQISTPNNERTVISAGAVTGGEIRASDANYPLLHID